MKNGTKILLYIPIMIGLLLWIQAFKNSGSDQPKGFLGMTSKSEFLVGAVFIGIPVAIFLIKTS